MSLAQGPVGPPDKSRGGHKEGPSPCAGFGIAEGVLRCQRGGTAGQGEAMLLLVQSLQVLQPILETGQRAATLGRLPLGAIRILVQVVQCSGPLRGPDPLTT